MDSTYKQHVMQDAGAASSVSLLLEELRKKLSSFGLLLESWQKQDEKGASASCWCWRNWPKNWRCCFFCHLVVGGAKDFLWAAARLLLSSCCLMSWGKSCLSLSCCWRADKNMELLLNKLMKKGATAFCWCWRSWSKNWRCCFFWLLVVGGAEEKTVFPLDCCWRADKKGALNSLWLTINCNWVSNGMEGEVMKNITCELLWSQKILYWRCACRMLRKLRATWFFLYRISFVQNWVSHRVPHS